MKKQDYHKTIRKPIAPPTKFFRTKKEKEDSKYKYSYEDELESEYGE